MSIVKLCGIAIIGVVAVLILRSYKSEFALPVSAVAGIIILTAAIATLYPVVSYITEISEGTGFALYSTTILKALGIGVISQCTADICRDSGENAIANKIEFAAKAIILLMGLPIIKNLLDLCAEVMKK